VKFWPGVNSTKGVPFLVPASITPHPD